jgi:DNA polymerase-3 subunit delta
MDCLTFLDKGPPKGVLLPVYILAGDQDFLKLQVRHVLRQHVLGESADPFALTVLPGDRANFADVIDTVSTRSFFAAQRMVVVQDADPFVTASRDRLERYVANPSTAGILVLEVKTWTSTTRLAKALVANTIQCKAPTRAKLPEWCVAWAQSRHQKQLAAPAARSLVDLVGEDMGLLDMELSKLALYVGDRAKITAEDVDHLVSNSREENIWKIFDHIGEGDAGSAVRLLDHLMTQGEDFFKLLGAMASSLRKLAQAGRLSQQGTPISEALERAGVPPFVRRGAEQQMRHLGRGRLNRLYDWLLETNMLARTTDGPPKELLLERLIVQLARKPEAGRIQ